MDNSEDKPIPTKNKVLISVCVLLLAAIMASWGISTCALENHECYVATAAREMLESGDWIMPTFNGKLRLEKTPLSYWLVAGLARITGRTDEFTARLPSAVFAVLTAAAMLYFVSRWLTFRIATISALIWATSYSYMYYSHNARPEMGLTFFVMLCFLCFYSAVNEKNRKRQIVYMLVFWVSFGLGMLAKGPAPLPLVLVPLFFYTVISRQRKKLTKLLPLAGPIIFLAIVLPWPLAIAHRVNWDLVVWKQHFFDRFFGEFDSGNYPFYFYLPFIFSFVAPWVAFVPAALAAPFYKIWGEKRKTMLFLWIWFVVDLIFLTMSGGKRKHYILPAMPGLAVLIGIIIEDMAFVRRAFTQKFARNFLACHIILIAVLAVGCVVYAAVSEPEYLSTALCSGLIGLAVAGGIAIFFAKRKAALACGILFGGYCILMVCTISFMNPLDNNNYTKTFAMEILERVPATEDLAAYGYVSPRVVNYFGRPVPVIEDKSSLYRRYEQGEWVLATAGELKELEKDSRLRKVYHSDEAEMRSRTKNTRGSLFHKSAPKAEDDLQKLSR